MALETLSSNELLNFIIYDTISATPFTCNDSSQTAMPNFYLPNLNSNPKPYLLSPQSAMEPAPTANISMQPNPIIKNNMNQLNLGVQKKKRRRRPRVCKNKEEAENQRMTHIAVERNRRKLMNEHLAVMRSLMPESYVQRGDQASIVGGAIEFVKELEHLLQSLEAQKILSSTQQEEKDEDISCADEVNLTKGLSSSSSSSPPFAQFFCYPQYTCSQTPYKYSSKSKEAIADIEVTLIETHANLRILSRKRLTQLSKMVACFQTLHMSVLHLNITTLDPLVLYSISLKVEEGCRLNSADEIAGAVHHMLRIIEEEAAASLCVDSIN